jgi:hypothetical protein
MDKLEHTKEKAAQRVGGCNYLVCILVIPLAHTAGRTTDGMGINNFDTLDYA